MEPQIVISLRLVSSVSKTEAAGGGGAGGVGEEEQEGLGSAGRWGAEQSQSAYSDSQSPGQSALGVDCS